MKGRLIPRLSALKAFLAVGSRLGATAFFASASLASGQTAAKPAYLILRPRFSSFLRASA